MNRFSACCLLLACAVTTACTGKPTGTSAAPSSAAKVSAANDYSKPYLTDEKMQQFLASMKEEHNPLELMFKPGGQTQNLATLGGRIEEFNSFARKYGFQDYQDYTGVWGRITVGEMQIWGAKTFEDMINGAQQELKKPDLTPEMRKVYEDQVTTAQKGLDDMNKKSTSVNAADMELIKKYKDQIDAAQKKYQAAK
ncbi:MAG TPA: hypothetical protein VE377_21565 [Candidatus Dormibacteraeota bacterium]|nr:hypothetical protein [Candidatus Dormibacteraeota bacterium]